MDSDDENIKMTPLEFQRRYKLDKYLKCPEEGWFISWIGDGHYEVQADDDNPKLCRNDDIAKRKAMERGIRFDGDNPFTPSDLINR